MGAALAAADVIIIPLAIAVILLMAILLGSKETCDRVFRLLRWIATGQNHPHPGPAGGEASRTRAFSAEAKTL